MFTTGAADTGPPLVLVADGLDTAIHRLDPVGPDGTARADLGGLQYLLESEQRG